MAGDQPKQMSSRLLTMKFMQRATAKNAASPSTPTGRPAKRARLSTGADSPATPSDQELVQAALAEEERKREEAAEKAAVAAGETKWYLSFRELDEIDKKPPGLNVVELGFAALESSDDDSEGEAKPVGRLTFGKKFKKPVATADGSSSDSDSDSSVDDEDDDEDLTENLIRKGERKAKKAAKRRKSEQFGTTSKRDVDLDRITSISGSGGLRSVTQSRSTVQGKCYSCGKTGHRRDSCPKGQNRGKRHAR